MVPYGLNLFTSITTFNCSCRQTEKPNLRSLVSRLASCHLDRINLTDVVTGVGSEGAGLSRSGRLVSGRPGGTAVGTGVDFTFGGIIDGTS